MTQAHWRSFGVPIAVTVLCLEPGGALWRIIVDAQQGNWRQEKFWSWSSSASVRISATVCEKNAADTFRDYINPRKIQLRTLQKKTAKYNSFQPNSTFTSTSLCGFDSRRFSSFILVMYTGLSVVYTGWHKLRIFDFFFQLLYIYCIYTILGGGWGWGEGRGGGPQKWRRKNRKIIEKIFLG